MSTSRHLWELRAGDRNVGAPLAERLRLGLSAVDLLTSRVWRLGFSYTGAQVRPGPCCSESTPEARVTGACDHWGTLRAAARIRRGPELARLAAARGLARTRSLAHPRPAPPAERRCSINNHKPPAHPPLKINNSVIRVISGASGAAEASRAAGRPAPWAGGRRGRARARLLQVPNEN